MWRLWQHYKPSQQCMLEWRCIIKRTRSLALERWERNQREATHSHAVSMLAWPRLESEPETLRGGEVSWELASARTHLGFLVWVKPRRMLPYHSPSSCIPTSLPRIGASSESTTYFVFCLKHCGMHLICCMFWECALMPMCLWTCQRFLKSYQKEGIMVWGLGEIFR